MSELDSLFESARALDAEPPAAAGQAIWAGVAAKAPLAQVTTATAASTGMSATLKVVLGVFAGISVISAGAVVATQSDEGPQAPAVETAPAVIEAPEPEEAQELIVIEDEGPQAEFDEATQRRPTKKRRTGKSKRSSAGLEEETKLLKSARMALARGNARAALKKLEQHQRQFPRGALLEVQRALRVQALCASGRTRDARKAAKTFLAKHRGSALTGQVESSCAFK